MMQASSIIVNRCKLSGFVAGIFCLTSVAVAAPEDGGKPGLGSLAVPEAKSAVVAVDPSIAAYQKTSGITGQLNSIGSDTLNNLMTLWTEKFSSFYPNVKVQVEGKGSGTAPPALIAGTAQLGPMSREMKASEVDEFEKKFSHKPMKVRVAVDALGVFVHKDNPIKGLTIEQLDAIFSKTRKQGGAADVLTWGELGLTGDWAKKPISLYGRNSASGTYGFFKEHVLKNGDFKDIVKEQPGSASVVQGIAVDKYGIGYSGIGYKTSAVKTVPLKSADNDTFVEGTPENAYSGDYALSRFLFIYLNKDPRAGVDPLVREFLKLTVSQEGQAVVAKDGYFPLPAEIAKEELAALQ